MNQQDGTFDEAAAAASNEQHERNLKSTLTAELLRSVLPASQPQEGSPPTTFTDSEVQNLQAALPGLHLRAREKADAHHKKNNSGNMLDICKPWEPPVIARTQDNTQEPTTNTSSSCCCPQEAPTNDILDWHGAPRFTPLDVQSPRDFRQEVRSGQFTGPTNAVCPGFLQCNLVVLPQGQTAFDFLLFCQRNPKACPLLEVCDVGSVTPAALAPTADLRTDVPKYAIYRNGKLVDEVTDVTNYWPENSVAFLIGCSFSYDGALMDAGIPLRSAQAGKNVPMFKTNLKCRSAGSLHGNIVVSMKPISAFDISKEIEITSKYPHAHGGPLCVGRPEAIGIDNLMQPDWGDAIELQNTEVPVFHACGVTPQSVLMDSKVPFAITHAAGHMFVTDRPADMGV